MTPPNRPRRIPPSPRRWWWAVGAYSALLGVASLAPSAGPRPGIPHFDKFLHGVEYLVLGWLLLQALRAAGAPVRTSMLRAWGLATSYGVLMEVLQAFVPWRSAEWMDGLANALGAAVGIWMSARISSARQS